MRSLPLVAMLLSTVMTAGAQNTPSNPAPKLQPYGELKSDADVRDNLYIAADNLGELTYYLSPKKDSPAPTGPDADAARAALQDNMARCDSLIEEGTRRLAKGIEVIPRNPAATPFLEHALHSLAVCKPSDPIWALQQCVAAAQTDVATDMGDLIENLSDPYRKAEDEVRDRNSLDRETKFLATQRKLLNDALVSR